MKDRGDSVWQTEPSKEQQQQQQMGSLLCYSEFGKNFSMNWVQGFLSVLMVHEKLSQYRFISPYKGENLSAYKLLNSLE